MSKVSKMEVSNNMDEEKIPNTENLPVDVSELGELQSAKQECPGVYYFVMKPEDQFGLLSKEYYYFGN